jgi:hypothetical protein
MPLMSGSLTGRVPWQKERAWGVSWKKMGMTKMATPIEIWARLTRATP